MPAEPYPARFARLYDWLVHGEQRPYPARELAFLERVFRERAGRPVRDVLDAGCGQGRLLVPLLRAGLRVTGVDASAPMLAACRRRLAAEGLRAPLERRRLEELDRAEEFDAAIAVDCVLATMRDDGTALAALRAIHRALRPGGVLVLDEWNMLGQPGLLAAPEPLDLGNGALRITGEQRHRLDGVRSLWETEFAVTVRENGRARRFLHRETLRARPPVEIESLLRAAGFEAVTAHAGYAPPGEGPAAPEQVQFTARRG